MLSWTLAANMLYSDPPRVNSLLDILKHINLVQTELDDAERVVSNKRFDCITLKAFHYFLLTEKASIVIEFFEWFPHWAGFLVRLMLAFIRSKQPGIKIHHELSQPLGHCWESTKIPILKLCKLWFLLANSGTNRLSKMVKISSNCVAILPPPTRWWWLWLIVIVIFTVN